MGVLPSHPSSSYSAVPRFPPRAGSSERVWGERTAHRLLRPSRLPTATRWGVGLEKRTGERRDERLGAAPTRWRWGASHGERPRIPRAASFSAPPRAATELKTAARR